MADVAYLKSLLAPHPDFPKKVSVSPVHYIRVHTGDL